MTFQVGNLVTVRGREWVVQPGTTADLALLHPLGGTPAETTGVLTALEEIRPARFPLPTLVDVGDFASGRLLRDALRLGFRSSAGPFRSFGRIAVQPRPYQLVPLLMALRLDPVRLLIADDVGIGKTVEALLIARELLDTGEATRLTVLCSPQLAEQWRAEMASKFHIDAELVLPSTIRRLERHLSSLSDTIFSRYPYTVVSTDFIKSDRHRHGFLRDAPDLIIVDEAHTAVASHGGNRNARGRSRHQRHELLRSLASDPDRHLLLVTATPHTGKEEGFRALLELLDPALADLPEDLSGEHNRHHREHLARHFVQRRRHDITTFLDTTAFPTRETAEATYQLHDDYARAIDRAVALARESVQAPATLGTTATGQRVRWWSALALLRSMASSPAAAAQTLRNRAAAAEAVTPEEADEIGRRTVMDLAEDESTEAVDVPPGADDADDDRYRRRLRELARVMDGLTGEKDPKLLAVTELVRSLVRDGFNPILFCRFIPTAEYVAEHLRVALGKQVAVAAVTGTLPPDEREARIAELGAASDRRVLVATDCLSEGINLQHLFDAVVHYDLSWNPTRHEQREGRVDRLGQPSPVVRTLTFHGTNNRIDPIVLDVLLRKHEAIRRSTGVSVPVPGDANRVLEALTEGLLVRGDGVQLTLDLQAEHEREQLHAEWETAAARYRPGSRTLYAQSTIDYGEVAEEVARARAAIGGDADVRQFLRDVTIAVDGTVAERPGPPERLELDFSTASRTVRDLLPPEHRRLVAAFTPPTDAGEELVTRTHPLVEKLAAHVVDTSLDPHTRPIAARAGAVRTQAVTTRTTLLLVRMRFTITVATGESLLERGGRAGEQDRRTMLAEDAAALAFTGPPQDAVWLPPREAEALFDATATGRVSQAQRERFVSAVIDGIDQLEPALAEMAMDRAAQLRDAHVRVRQAARTRRPRTVTVDPHLPADLLGVYVLLPDLGEVTR